MLTITTSDHVPDGAYFTTSDVEPTLSGDTLTIYTGKGSRRSSWGAPETTSTVVLHDDALVAVHVGFHHKHRGGQGWFYYVPVERPNPFSAAVWRRVSWLTLRDAERQRVLDAAMTTAPRWATVPGKLHTQRAAPTSTTRTAYKLVRVHDDGTMRSVFDGQTVYEVGKRLAERAVADHQGGYYAYPSEAGLRSALRAGTLWAPSLHRHAMRLALLEVELSGTILEYDADGAWLPADDVYGTPAKLAATYLRPVRVVETFDYVPAEQLTEVR